MDCHPERFIQNVVSQLGRHDVSVDSLSGGELDQLADVIADALQVVDQDGGRRAGEGPGKAGPLSSGPPGHQGALQDLAAPPDTAAAAQGPGKSYDHGTRRRRDGSGF
ncbi:hypothetical protein COCON_G00137850 [Conger conger]|uniref:Uncharacterized protein n=1 Tax=Conger conger TaxID=82655 RepID=A0A9Q1HW44_CONCO|nr:hypothetical protein COCON_G00137850 [Conger conger]